MRGRTRRAPPRTARAGRTRCRGCTRRSRTPGRGATRACTPGSRPRAGRGRRVRRRGCSRGCDPRIRARPHARSTRGRPRTRVRRRARCPGDTPPPLGRGLPSAGGRGRRPAGRPSAPHQPRGRFKDSAVAVRDESMRGLRSSALSRLAPLDCVRSHRVSTMDVESFSKTKVMELPRNVVVGHDAVHQVGEVCQSLKLGKRALIVADETTMKIAGAIVEKELGARKVKTAVYLIPDATMAEVREAEEKIRKGTFDFALGVGGGRSIDVAKCASFNAGVPFVSVPTAASHDGVVSSRASIQKDGERVSLAAQTPIAVIMDTAIIAESPFRLLAAGCGDIISNLVAVKDWALARNLRNEYYSSYAAALSELAARLVIENASTIKPRLEESARFVCKALVSSGVAMSIAGSSRPASGSEHKFSHALDRLAKKPALHGEQCGVG